MPACFSIVSIISCRNPATVSLPERSIEELAQARLRGRRRALRAPAAPRCPATGDTRSRSSAARRPKTRISTSEFEPRRLAPLMLTQAHSPAANRPGSGVARFRVGVDAAHHVVNDRTHRHRVGNGIDVEIARRELAHERQALVDDPSRRDGACRAACTRPTASPACCLCVRPARTPGSRDRAGPSSIVFSCGWPSGVSGPMP